MKKVFCFGELLLRYSPAFNRQWIEDASMPVFIGGAELNVATALAKWSIPTKYVTALPGHALSQEIIQELQHKNIDVSSVLFQGNRIGTYYLPQGADLKNAGVIYDRAGSSFGELQPGMIDWDTTLKDCDWFHFSAISPALNENVAAVCKEALEAASAMGLTISVDLNYRSKLW
jgi:2-dehydro-3-deoxygluconokinase